MILPYVYKLTHKETGQFYIGFRYANKTIAVEDLGINYFSSSKKVMELGFENFNIDFIAEFIHSNAAYDYEQALIKENISNPLILNKHYCLNGVRRFNKFGIEINDNTIKKQSISKLGSKNPMHGKTHSSESKEKMSINKGEIDHRNDRNPMHGKIHSSESKEKMRKAKIGKLLSEETKKKLSKKVIINNIIFDSVKLAMEYFNNTSIAKILTGKYKLNDKIWQAEYINSIENVINE